MLLAVERVLLMKRVLFVCIENSNRSQMAEAFAHMLGGPEVEASSAGSAPSGVINPKAIAAMAELGYDLAMHASKSLADITGDFGARFGFLLGSLSMAVSGVITGGIGPWLPFQMWALGWVGGGAAVVRALSGGRAPRAWLAAYGWVAGLAFGALLNLWFWPFQGGRAAVSYSPDLSAWQTLVHYWRFYVLTSLAWDSARAFGNAILIAVVGAPLLRLFTRFRSRMLVVWGAQAAEDGVASSV